MRVLRGQQLRESDYRGIQEQLEALFYRLVFKPMVDLMAPHNAQVRAARAELRNAVGPLSNAGFSPIVAGINSGRIQYVDDTFSGEFSAAISRALRSYGARFDKRTSTFVVLPQYLPVEVLEAAKAYSDLAKQLHEKLMSTLNGIEGDLKSGRVRDSVNGLALVSKANKRFDEDYGDALGTRDLSEGAKMALAKAYEQSLRPYIEEFTGKMIGELRGIVAGNARAGYRFDNLVDRIENRYSVSRSKAEFLARNETSNFMSKVREARFGDAGVTEYVWDTAGDTEVREGHRELNGRTFTFAGKAPARYMSSGKPCNPGEDFNCRCVANPVMPGVLAYA